ncbi:FAD binding domain-containing protein [Shewanella marina]|uniref:FAD binding domain-containing protein n=1 Tax=Shewanella marina TaxID=487319 RepID=UPI000470565F|nr:FAD binding domain-containing protein [Shewanella marina]
MVAIYRPTQLADALAVLTNETCTVFAGGTDLMVRHRVRPNIVADFSQPVMFIDAITELGQIQTLADGTLRIGAAVTLAQLIAHPLIPDLLKQSAAKIAAPALRNRATLVGNVCNASPAADTLPILYLLDAKVQLQSCQGERTMALTQFILGPGQTPIDGCELLTWLEIPPQQFTQTFYHKVGTRAANALTKVSVVAAAQVVDEHVLDWRIAFGAVAPTVVRSPSLEQLVVGLNVSQLQQTHFITQLQQQYAELIVPIDDQRSTAKYRKQVALNLLKRWLLMIN